VTLGSSGADAAPAINIVQLYQDQDFSAAPSAGLPALVSRTERHHMVSTLTHWIAFRPRLEARHRCASATGTRTVMVVDSEESARFMRGRMPDSTVSQASSPTSSDSGAGGSYPKVRVWGRNGRCPWEPGTSPPA